MKERKVSTISDVANLAGVSASTVSRHVNRTGYVSTEVAQRINEAVKELNYVPNRYARVLKASHTKEIAMIVPDIINPYYAAAYTAAQEYAENYGYVALLYNAAKSAEGEIKGLRVCRDMQVDGLIFITENSDETVMEHLANLSIPVVLSFPQKPLRFDAVYSQGHGIYDATKYLCELGHKRIAFSGGSADSHINRNRRDGYKRAMEENGLTTTSDYIFEMAFSVESGYKSGLFFNSLRTPPTAIVAANDIIAMGVMMALNEVGKCIPDDVSLTGEDNIDFTKICRPKLTTVDNDPIYLSVKACEFLFSRLIDGYNGNARVHICPRKLIVRGSTAPPKGLMPITM